MRTAATLRTGRNAPNNLHGLNNGKSGAMEIPAYGAIMQLGSESESYDDRELSDQG